MTKTLIKFALPGILAFSLNTANAELFINPAEKLQNGASDVSLHFGTSDVDYDFDGVNADIERTFFGGTYAFASSPKLDIFFTFSYTMEAEIENGPDDSGIMLGGGARFSIPNQRGLNLVGYGQLLLIDEDYTSNVSGEETYILLGLSISTKLEQNFVVYGGPELNLYSDMDIEGVDGDRDDVLGFRVGANYDAGDFLLNFNLALMHESGMFFSVSRLF